MVSNEILLNYIIINNYYDRFHLFILYLVMGEINYATQYIRHILTKLIQIAVFYLNMKTIIIVL